MQPGTLGGDEIAPAKKYKQIISAENFARSFMRYMSSMSEKTNASSRVKPFFSARSLALWSSPYALFRLSFPKTNFSARAVFRDQLCDLIPQVAGIISLLLASFSHMIFLLKTAKSFPLSVSMGMYVLKFIRKSIESC